MKKINKPKKSNTPVSPQHRSFRRFVKKMFASFIKHPGKIPKVKFQETVLEKLQDIQDSIEIMAREMARQAKRNE